MENDESRARSSVLYNLLVQFIPSDARLWSNQQKGLSGFRGEVPIYIFCPKPPEQSNGRKGTLTLSVGGFLGIRSRECTCKVSVLSTVCNIGNSIDVKVDCDNSKCNKAVTDFNIAIERTHLLKTDDGYNKEFN